MVLNLNIPYQRAYVRDCYLYSDDRKSLSVCYIFGVKTLINRPLLFHCQVDNGAVFWSLPISAFVHNKEFEMMGETESERLTNLQWWDCQSNDGAVTQFTYLDGYIADCKSRNKSWNKGKYLFSIDNYVADRNNGVEGYSLDPDSKVYHFMKLENGNFGVYPNNYMRWHNLNFVDPYDKSNPPKYKPNNFELRAEVDKAT